MASPYDRLRGQLAAHPKKWLITGVAGFIGSNLLEELLRLGQTVTGLDNFSTGSRANLDDVVSRQGGEAATRFRMITGDIRDAAVCREACEGVDVVLHQAALGSVPRSVADPLTSHQVNVDGFLHVLLATKHARVARLVFASSSSVYGDETQLPQVEEKTGRVLSPYAATKASNELYADVYQRVYGLELVGLRYFNVFGRRQNPDGPYAAVIPRWVANLLSGRPCEIYGDGETSRDFCYVENVVQANLLAAAGPSETTGQIYNIACGQSTSLNSLYYLIRDKLLARHPQAYAGEPERRPFRAGDIRHSLASIQKAQRLLGYSPTHLVADGLTEALAWYTQMESRPNP